MRQSSIATLKAPTAYAHKGQILEQLQDAVQEHEVIAIVHQKPGNLAPRERAVEPYALWFTTMELAGLPELAAWVARYVGEVLPMSPPHFRELVRERFTRGLERLDEATPPVPARAASDT